jgi:PAS domain S-box-containing protein
MAPPRLIAQQLRQTLTRTLVLPLILMAILAGVFLLQVNALLATTQWVDHTDQAIAQINATQKLVVDMETGVRGYLLTGRSDFLDPYRQAIFAIDPAFDNLNRLIANNPEQIQRLSTVRATYAGWATYTHSLIALREGGGAYQEAVASAESKRLIDTLRGQLALMLESEELQRDQQTRASKQATGWIVGVSISLAILLGGALALFARRQLLTVSQSYEQALAIAQDRATALRESELRYRSLVETSPDAILLTSLDGTIHFCNQQAAHLYGFPRPEDLVGMNAFSFSLPEGLQRVQADARPPGAGNIRNVEYTLRRSDGTRLPVEISHSLIHDPDGTPSAFIATIRDITDRKRAAEALEAERALLARRVEERTTDLSLANAELARAAQLKDEFLTSMSHELRTPLNAILGLSEALEEQVYGPLNTQQRKTIQSVAESGRHLLALINDILDLSKISAGKLELDMEQVDIAMVCHSSLQFVRQLAHKKRITVISTLDPSVRTIQADERRLKQILVNLLSNAVKFTPEDGTVGLEVVGDPDHQIIQMTVWDTGIGIDQADQERLFEPFIQLDSRLARQYEGTGLGLALVARMVELHGGGIAVTSTVGQGSRFTVSLPWQNLDGPSGKTETFLQGEPARPIKPRIHQVLIIEDSPTTASQLTRYLNELGVNATIYPWASDAIARTLDVRPDAIILDILLPDHSGWQTLAELKADSRTQAIPVLVASVVDDRARGLALGASEYLVKPISRSQLQAALHKMFPPEPEQAVQLASNVVYQPDTARSVIVLAEDNEANIITLSDYLRNKGFQVVVARNGIEAIAQVHAVYPDVILMDIQMPVMDGLEATRRIRANADLTHIPIIALTALAMPGDRERCLEAGANAYLSKPVKMSELVTAIEAQMRQRERGL